MEIMMGSRVNKPTPLIKLICTTVIVLGDYNNTQIMIKFELKSLFIRSCPDEHYSCNTNKKLSSESL
ncbi:hypothetical protein J2TS6_48120 [Paenibacillus albilobatus]|uniref:Uncharacterized protein n=1 Tax=Paenibacillus albilobatus TaxID=2716884 RepID=A0A920CBK7_9BACL|nr:hypothetical protein J2TS6_48120 [Paenibacillus albilobatus]